MSWSPRPVNCSCRPEDHEECGLCSRARNVAAYKRLTPAERRYDDYVDPLGAYHENYDPSCSCHISPPCSFCTSQGEEDVTP